MFWAGVVSVAPAVPAPGSVLSPESLASPPGSSLILPRLRFWHTSSQRPEKTLRGGWGRGGKLLVGLSARPDDNPLLGLGPGQAEVVGPPRSDDPREASAGFSPGLQDILFGTVVITSVYNLMKSDSPPVSASMPARIEGNVLFCETITQ